MAVVGTDLLLIERDGNLHKATASEVAALGGAGGILKGTATITVEDGLPGNAGTYQHIETVAAVGVSGANTVVLTVPAGDDTDENDFEMLDIASFTARPLTDQIEIIANFTTPTSGPVNFNWSAF